MHRFVVLSPLRNEGSAVQLSLFSGVSITTGDGKASAQPGETRVLNEQDFDKVMQQ